MDSINIFSTDRIYWPSLEMALPVTVYDIHLISLRT